MNKISLFFESLEDAVLRSAVAELKELYDTGVLPAGIVRNSAQLLAQDAGIPHGVALSLAQSESLRIAAYRWAGLAPSVSLESP